MPGPPFAFWGITMPPPVTNITTLPWLQQLTCASAVPTHPWGGLTAIMFPANYVTLFPIKVPPPALSRFLFHPHLPLPLPIFLCHRLRMATLPPSSPNAFLSPSAPHGFIFSTSCLPPLHSSTPPRMLSSTRLSPAVSSPPSHTMPPEGRKTCVLSARCSPSTCLHLSTGSLE
jgi:hypothetical protein